MDFYFSPLQKNLFQPKFRNMAFVYYWIFLRKGFHYLKTMMNRVPLEIMQIVFQKMKGFFIDSSKVKWSVNFLSDKEYFEKHLSFYTFLLLLILFHYIVRYFFLTSCNTMNCFLIPKGRWNSQGIFSASSKRCFIFK